jgi:hypothetical protein
VSVSISKVNQTGAIMDAKKVIEKLIKIADNQQKIIQRLAQTTSMTAPSPTNINPVQPPKREADTILASLPPNLKPLVANIEVHGNEVYLTFQPGKASQQVFDAVKVVIQHLQQSNQLPGQNYQIHSVE